MGMVERKDGRSFGSSDPQPSELHPGLRVPPELEMRTGAIQIFINTSSAFFKPLAHQYAQFDVNPSSQNLRHLTIQGIAAARRSNQWSNSAPQDLRMGFYKDEATFYTNLFHEVTHNTLTRLGRPNSQYYANPEREEEFCWDASRKLTTLAGLPFSEETASLQFEIFRENQIERDKNAKIARLIELAEKEEKLLGFSSYGRSEFVWSHLGMPEKVA